MLELVAVRSGTVIAHGDEDRDLAALVVPLRGSLVGTGEPFEPFRLAGPDGEVVGAVSVFMRDLMARGCPASTQRSYGMDLLRWYRFLWAAEVPWEQATRAEARDFCCWLQVADKPRRGHWRHPDGEPPAAARAAVPNPVTGKLPPGPKLAPATVAHCESVVRGFYDFHLEAGTGPIVNPFPLARQRGGGRGNAHRNPMDPYLNARAGRYRPRVAARIPRQIPDGLFNELFARLESMRDRALVAFWVSTGARAAELLGAASGDADPGQQLVTVVRKGTRAVQQLPASPDSFVWLRLYQEQMHGKVPGRRDDPLWWTLRRPFRPLSYDAARLMFTRAGAALGANWSLHDLRHTAAYRMARDPGMPLTDVQWVLGHAQLSTTQVYLRPAPADVIAGTLAFHARMAGERAAAPDPGPAAAGYRPESLDVLFGKGAS